MPVLFGGPVGGLPMFFAGQIGVLPVFIVGRVGGVRVFIVGRIGRVPVFIAGQIGGAPVPVGSCVGPLVGITPAAPGFAISTCMSNEALPSTIFPPPEIRILDCPKSDSKVGKIIIN